MVARKLIWFGIIGQNKYRCNRVIALSLFLIRTQKVNYRTTRTTFLKILQLSAKSFLGSMSNLWQERKRLSLSFFQDCNKVVRNIVQIMNVYGSTLDSSFWFLTPQKSKSVAQEDQNTINMPCNETIRVQIVWFDRPQVRSMVDIWCPHPAASLWFEFSQA